MACPAQKSLPDNLCNATEPLHNACLALSPGTHCVLGICKRVPSCLSILACRQHRCTTPALPCDQALPPGPAHTLQNSGRHSPKPCRGHLPCVGVHNHGLNVHVPRQDGLVLGKRLQPHPSAQLLDERALVRLCDGAVALKQGLTARQQGGQGGTGSQKGRRGREEGLKGNLSVRQAGSRESGDGAEKAILFNQAGKQAGRQRGQHGGC